VLAEEIPTLGEVVSFPQLSLEPEIAAVEPEAPSMGGFSLELIEEEPQPVPQSTAPDISGLPFEAPDLEPASLAEPMPTEIPELAPPVSESARAPAPRPQRATPDAWRRQPAKVLRVEHRPTVKKGLWARILGFLGLGRKG